MPKAMKEKNLTASDQLRSETLRSLDILGNCVRHLVRVEMPRALGPVPMVSIGKIDQSLIFEYLTESHEFVRRRLEKLANLMTDLEWFWYIRNLPEDVFAGALPTTGPHDRLLAETAGVLWGRKSKTKRTLSRDGSLQLEVSREKIRLLLEFCAYIKALATVQSNLRWCGKGAQFVLSAYGTLEPDSASLRESVALYDDRVAANTYCRFSFAGAGTQVGEYSWSDLTALKPFEVLVIAKSNLACEYRPALFDLEKVKDLNQAVGTTWWHPSAPALIALLKLGAIVCELIPEEKVSLSRFGYMLIEKAKLERLYLQSKSIVEKMISTIFPDAEVPGNVLDILKEIDIMRGSVWPLRPAVTAFEIGKFILLDYASLGGRSKHVFEFPRVSSKVGNARAGHFELMAQDLINSTSWRPSESLAKLRGKPIQSGGRTITDLDAIGAKDGKLLIVDCKSLIHDSLYDQGHPSKVRSAIDAIEAKVEHWEKIRQYFLQNRTGTNYDFAAYDEIIAVVCTPSPIYLPLGPATEQIGDGLMRCCSLNELDVFLNRR